MALDQNLFTLKLEPSKTSPGGVDLVESSGMVYYRKIWVPNNKDAYCFSLCDPLSNSVLATVTAPSASSKQKLIELHNPSVPIRLNYTGLLSFRWTFTWEGSQFDWKREECYMIRKPDPPVLVAVTKEPPGKIQTSVVQILDYNIQRFEIQDRKGLEIALLTSLLTFPDYSEQMKNKAVGVSPLPQPSASQPPSRPQPSVPTYTRTPQPSSFVPQPPPKPEGWTGDQIAILQAKEQRDVNEVVVGDVGTLDDYIKHCISLLSDETLLYITLRSQSTANVPKVVQIAEATKRSWYKTSGYDEELFQYVDASLDEMSSKGKGKARRGVINLNDPPTNVPPSSNTFYEPPSSLIIHLSKISMPELEPKTKGKSPRFVVREHSPERKVDKEKGHHGHHRGHKHHMSEMAIGAERLASPRDAKGKSHHHSHSSQNISLLRSPTQANTYINRPSPTSSEQSSSHRPSLKISSSTNSLKSPSTRTHSSFPRPLPLSPASSSTSASPSGSGALSSTSPAIQYNTMYPDRGLSSPAPPPRGGLWKRR